MRRIKLQEAGGKVSDIFGGFESAGFNLVSSN